MANAYHLRCVRDYEVVVPASRIILTGFDGVSHETGDILPEKRFWHRRGETYKARRKAEAEALVRTGNWEWAY